MTALPSRFVSRAAFAPQTDYRLLPFRFGRLDRDRYVVTNDVGEYVVLSRPDLTAFAERRLDTTGEPYRKLKAKHFLFDADSECAVDLLALKVRSRAERVAQFTGLHIFVLTLRCDHSCHYCQVSRQTEDRAAFDMSIAHADAALDSAFRSPSRALKIEFQGGEPLLAFDTLEHVVLRAKEMNVAYAKDLAFVIATNLSKLTDEHLAFAKDHGIVFSTSLDGPKDLHDAHRPMRGGSSYDAALRGIARVREALGSHGVSALMTTTPASLERIQEIVDEYVRRGFEGIFLRSLSPFGFAVKTRLLRKLGVDDWLRFYERGLARTIDVAASGVPFREEYTSILLHKIFGASGTGYVDLQSPAGIGIGAIVYNYDGSVYASDEGRMLAEMGDTSFRLGQLGVDSYEAMMTSEALIGPLDDTILESSPMCTDCPYLPYCGADPVYHRATQADHVGHKALSSFCTKQTHVLTHLLRLLEDDSRAREVLMGWA